MSRYILAVDQSTQGTKGLLFDERGGLVARADRPHRQIISPEGWVSHDPWKSGPTPWRCAGTWWRRRTSIKTTSPPWVFQPAGRPPWPGTGTPASICPAIVWQCARATAFCEERKSWGDKVQQRTGIPLSPYFPAAKMGWILEHVPEARRLARETGLGYRGQLADLIPESGPGPQDRLLQRQPHPALRHPQAVLGSGAL